MEKYNFRDFVRSLWQMIFLIIDGWINDHDFSKTGLLRDLTKTMLSKWYGRWPGARARNRTLVARLVAEPPVNSLLCYY